MGINLPAEWWIVVTQYDTSPADPEKRGPLVHEGYLLSREEAIDRAKTLSVRYGWAAALPVRGVAGHVFGLADGDGARIESAPSASMEAGP